MHVHNTGWAHNKIHFNRWELLFGNLVKTNMSDDPVSLLQIKISNKIQYFMSRQLVYKTNNFKDHTHGLISNYVTDPVFDKICSITINLATYLIIFCSVGVYNTRLWMIYLQWFNIGNVILTYTFLSKAKQWQKIVFSWASTNEVYWGICYFTFIQYSSVQNKFFT